MNDDIPALSTRDLTISFGGQVAVNAVTCDFRQGTLTAIVGPNGAGKATYFNLISGQLQPSNGSVSLFAMTSRGSARRSARAAGSAARSS
jgi:branched-chain amino acid transport system ATP-binding protein